MGIRFDKLKRVTAPGRGSRSQTVIREITEPFLGTRTDLSRHALRPGQSGDMANFLVEKGRLRSRPSASSLTQYTNSVVGGTGIGLSSFFFLNPDIREVNSSAEVAAVYGRWISNSSASIMGLQLSSSAGWSNLTTDSKVSLVGSEKYTTATFRMPDVFSGALSWVAAGIYNRPPIVGSLDGFTSIVTILANYESVSSGAARTAVFDSRLIFADEAIGTTRFPQRIRWTARGTGTDFTSIGAGLEDLNGITGPIRFLYPQEDRLLIFASNDLWAATPRRDDYAFDFNRIQRSTGCDDPQLFVDTPIGLIWVYQNGLHRLVGNQIRGLSPTLEHELRQYTWRAPGSSNGIVSITYSNRENALVIFAGTGSATSATVYVIDLHTLHTSDVLDYDEAIWTTHSVPLHGTVGTEPPGADNITSITDADTNVDSSAVYSPFRSPIFVPQMSGNTAVFQMFNFVGSSNETAHFTTHIPEGTRDSRQMDMLREIGLDYEVMGSSVSVYIGVSASVGASFTTVGSGVLPSGKSHIDIALIPLRTRNPLVKIAGVTSDSSSTFYFDRITFTGRTWTGHRGT